MSIDLILDHFRSFMQQPLLAVSQGDFLIWSVLILGLFLYESSYTSRLYGKILNDKNEILEKQHDELTRKRSRIEEMEKVIEKQSKLIEEISSAGSVHKIFVKFTDGHSPTDISEDELKKAKH